MYEHLEKPIKSKVMSLDLISKFPDSTADQLTFSKMLATAKMVEGDTSCSLQAMDCSKLSAVSFKPLV